MAKLDLSFFCSMPRPRVYSNTVVFLVPRGAFTDGYPGTTFAGASFVFSNLSSSVPVHAGSFHVDICADDGIKGFYMLSRVPANTQADRRQLPRIGIPVQPEGSTWARSPLPEKPAEYIGSGLICSPMYDTGQSVLDVPVIYRLHQSDSLILTFAVDLDSLADFSLLCLFRFSSTLRV
jgi:hypothetical protein